MTTKLKRTTFHLYYSKERKRWETSVGGMIVDAFDPEITAVGAAHFIRGECWNLWEYSGVPCELIIHNKRDGKVSARGKSTYGNDPKKSRG